MTDDKKRKHEHHHRKPALVEAEDTVTSEEEEKWNPTPEVFEAFLVRDEQLAASNLRLLLKGSRNPVSLKELRGSLLHSNETIDRVLAAGVQDGTVSQDKDGDYSLVNVRNT